MENAGTLFMSFFYPQGTSGRRNFTGGHPRKSIVTFLAQFLAQFEIQACKSLGGLSMADCLSNPRFTSNDTCNRWNRIRSLRADVDQKEWK